MPHRHSIATVALGGTLGEKLAAASAAGFDGVELFEPDLIAAPLAPEEVRRRLADLGLVLELYQPLRDIDALPPERFRRKLDLVRAKFDLMRRLGARMALLCTNVSPDAIDDDDLAAEQLSRGRGRGASPRPDRRLRGARLGNARQRVRPRVAHRRASWASGPRRSAWTASTSWPAAPASAGIAAIPADKLFMLQLADAPRLRMDELQWSRHYRCFPGQGAFDLESFLVAVLAAGYTGPLSLEIFNDIFRQADPFRTAVDGRRSLLWLAERRTRLAPDAAPAAGSQSRAGERPAQPRRSLAAGPAACRSRTACAVSRSSSSTRRRRPRTAWSVLLTGLGLRRTGTAQEQARRAMGGRRGAHPGEQRPPLRARARAVRRGRRRSRRGAAGAGRAAGRRAARAACPTAPELGRGGPGGHRGAGRRGDLPVRGRQRLARRLRPLRRRAPVRCQDPAHRHRPRGAGRSR